MNQIKIKKSNKVLKTIIKKTANHSISVYDLNAKKIDSIDYPDTLIVKKMSPKLIAQYLRVYLSHQKPKTSQAKTRQYVQGSTRKIYRQKGTGKARHGDIKAPIFVGGGVIHGPLALKRKLKLNKKQIKKALYASLTIKLQDKLVYSIALPDKKQIKTNDVNTFLKSMNLKNKKCLFILSRNDKEFKNSINNILKTAYTYYDHLSAYTLLSNLAIIFTNNALKEFINQKTKHENK